MEPKAKVIQLIELRFDRGAGSELREVTQYRTPGGKVLWERDPMRDQARVDVFPPTQQANGAVHQDEPDIRF